MTYQISKDLKTHVVLTFSGSEHFINAKQELALRQMSDSDRLYLDEAMVRVNTIKEIVPIETYYKNNPEKRPRYENYTYNDASRIPKTPNINRLRALKSMKRGFLKHFHGREMGEYAKNILKNMDAVIARAETGQEVEISPGKLMNK
jgi:hypothetical protein